MHKPKSMQENESHGIIDHNTENSPGELRRHSLTQNLVEVDQLTLVCKTLKE